MIGLRSRVLPRGVLIGIAAAVKLTPLIFIPLLLLTRQRRAAVTASVTFLLCTLTTLAVAPHSSWLYWSKEIFNPTRAGNLLYVSNQNLHSALQRMAQVPPSHLLLNALTIALGAGGLLLAALAYRESSPLLGITLCAATGLVVSPVSWTHHYVWVVPALAWLILSPDRPKRGVWWAAGVALIFWSAPMWLVPDWQRGYGGPLVLIASNSFLLVALAFLVLSGLMLWFRRRRGAALMDGPLVEAAGVAPLRRRATPAGVRA
jgi:alpha-1,2-mannosyltransferase